MEADKQNLRHRILSAFKLKKNVAEATRMICTDLGQDAVTYKTCKKWYQRFRNGDFDLSDRRRSGQPQKFRDTDLEQLLTGNSAQTQRELAFQLGVTQQCISLRLHHLGKIQKEGRWIRTTPPSPHEPDNLLINIRFPNSTNLSCSVFNLEKLSFSQVFPFCVFIFTIHIPKMLPLLYMHIISSCTVKNSDAFLHQFCYKDRVCNEG